MKRSIKFLLVVVTVAVTLFLGDNILKANVDAWPFLEVSKDNTTVCYPFYTRDKDFTMLLNFYVKSNHGKDTHIFWPFVKFSDGKLTKVIPFWFAENSNNFALLPFIVHNEDSTFWLVPPVYTKDSGDYLAIYPFFIKSKTSTFFFPDVYLEDDGNKIFRTVFPFYKHEYTKKNPLNSFNYRLMNYVHNVNENGDDYTSFFPFYENSLFDKGNQQKLIMFPYIYKQDKKEGFKQHIVFPFYASNESKKGNSTWCLNYYSKHSENIDELDVFPFFGNKNEKLDQGEKKNNLWVMWPLYSKEIITNNEGAVLSSKKRFLIFENEKTSSGRRTLSLFGFVVREEIN